MEQQAKQLNFYHRQIVLDIKRELATLEALFNGEHEAITNPEEGSILHPEYQVEEDISVEDIKY